MKSIKRSTAYRFNGSRLRKYWFIGIVVIPLLIMAQSSCAELNINSKHEPKFLEYLSKQTTFYAGKTYNLSWAQGQDYWPQVDNYIVRIYYANKILMEEQLERTSPLTFQMKYPPLRPGVNVQAILTISAVFQGKIQDDVYTMDLYFYSQEQPFKEGESLQALDFGVLDKTENKSLVKFLNDIGAPFTELNTLTDFKGRWIIASGLDFEQYYSLFNELYSKLQNGTSVLIVPPANGSFSMPVYQSQQRLVVTDQNILKDINKNWNLETINHLVKGSDVSFVQSIVGDGVGFNVLQGKVGASWVEFSQMKNKMVFCGWDLAALYKENPTASMFIYYLFSNE